MDNVPSVAFVVLVGSDADRLIGCLETIARQEYPEKQVETIVVDLGGGVDVAEVALRFGVPVIHGEQEDVASRINIGISSTRADIVFAIGSDGGLSRTDWIRMMVRPFTERPEVGGVFTQIVEMPTDSAFARYLCRLSGSPFVWFVHGDTANPRYCRGMYGIAGSGEGYTIHLFPHRRPPLIKADCGVGVRRSALQGLSAGNEADLPLIRLIEGGQPVALVPDAGVHHQNADSLWLYLAAQYALLREGSSGRSVCAEQHPAHRSYWRRVRKHLFVIYGLTVIMPLLDGIWLSLLEKDTCMLWHGPSTIAMSWLVVVDRARMLVSGSVDR